MKKAIYSTTLLISALYLASPAFAVPMQYEINFDGPIAGTGSFIWDKDTQLMSDFNWSIGSYSGGVDNMLYPWDAAILGGNQSQYLFEVLTLENVHPYTCSDPATSYCGVEINQTYGDFDTANFTVTDLNLRKYSFMIGSEFIAYGTWTTRMVGTVPAPSSFLLLSLGVIGLSFARRK